MTTEEWDQKRKLWCDVVEGIIPPERLQEVFTEAIRRHTDSFPLAVSELIPAWSVVVDRSWQEAQRLAGAAKVCLTCLEAKAQNVLCPYHGSHYKLGHEGPS